MAPATLVAVRFNEFPKHSGAFEDAVTIGIELIMAFVVPAILLQPATVAVTT